MTKVYDKVAKQRYYKLWNRYNNYLILTNQPPITSDLFRNAYTLEQVTAIVEEKCRQHNLLD